MGQGQAAQAQSLLHSCTTQGSWLCLQNLHLAPSWLPSLEGLLHTLLPTAHKNFQLFITTEPSEKFPQTLLEMSLKATFQYP